MRRRNAGFTLIEMMVVVVIIGILATVVIAAVWGRDQPARQTVTRALAKELAAQVSMFRLDHGRFPAGLEDLVFRPEDVDPDRWSPYIDELSTDGWGRAFIYNVPGSDAFPFDIGSYGADGQPGGEGFDADVWNHARRE